MAPVLLSLGALVLALFIGAEIVRARETLPEIFPVVETYRVEYE